MQPSFWDERYRGETYAYGRAPNDFDLVVAREVEREIHEGVFHDGRSATAQLVGVLRP
jgi:hypothetical protein